jgi:hypothetical protein|tara:strand:+ start:360 stop:551 length:192 start_codon:yes stop_codon:yes gene_type:complete
VPGGFSISAITYEAKEAMNIANKTFCPAVGHSPKSKAGLFLYVIPSFDEKQVNSNVWLPTIKV